MKRKASTTILGILICLLLIASVAPLQVFAASDYLDSCKKFGSYCTLYSISEIRALPTRDSTLIKQGNSPMVFTTDTLYKNPSSEYWYHGKDDKGNVGYVFAYDGIIPELPAVNEVTITGGQPDFAKGSASSGIFRLSGPGEFKFLMTSKFSTEDGALSTSDYPIVSWESSDTILNWAEVALSENYLNTFPVGKISFSIKGTLFNYFVENGKLNHTQTDFSKDVSFTVKEESKLKIAPTKTSYTITHGSTCSIGGKITSNYKITNVKATLDGKQYANFSPNSKSVDISDSSSGKLNSFKGANLDVGTHKIVITATDGWKSVSSTIKITVNPKTYTVKYNGNGGTAPSSQTKTEGETLTLSTMQPERDGYIFKGWSTSKDGSVAYQPGGKYKKDANVTLYAVWEPVKTYTVTYDGNGGTAPASQTKTAGVDLKLTTEFPEREGYIFRGWSIGKISSFEYQVCRFVDYKAGGTYTSDSDITLYAVWDRKIAIVSQTDTATAAPGTSAVLEVEAVGDLLTYQWSRTYRYYAYNSGVKWEDIEDGSKYSGTKSEYLGILTEDAVEEYAYRCTISNSTQSEQSDPIFVNVFPITTRITRQPQDWTVRVGRTATISYGYTGSSIEPTWQIKYPGSDEWKSIDGVDGVTKYSITQLRIKGLESLNGCQFRVIVAGAAGTVISDPCTLTVDTQTESTLQSIDGQIVQVALGKEETENNDIKISGSVSEDKPVLVASYDEEGRFLGLVKVSAPDANVKADENAYTVKCFWIDENGTPLSSDETLMVK